MINKIFVFITFLIISFISVPVSAKDRKGKKALLNKIYTYSAGLREQLPDSIESNNYTKLSIDFVRKNFAIYSIPHVFQLIRSGEREHFLEIYSHATYFKNNEQKPNRNEFLRTKSHRNVYVSTIRKRREAFEVVTDYLIPDIYRTTMIDDQLLSPFAKGNRRYYIYHNVKMNDSLTHVQFKPKVKHTMLGKGHAIVESSTGRIVSYEISSEYDMMSYTLNVVMNDDNVKSLFPKICDFNSKISYLGNIIKIDAKVFYDQPVTFPDSITNVNSRKMMAPLRPEPLNDEEQQIMVRSAEKLRKKYNMPDSISVDSVLEIGGYAGKKRTGFQHFIWDVIGDNLLSNIKGKFGPEDRGSYRIGPLLNPGYFGYSDSKGLIYKLKMKARFYINENSEISLNAKYAYAFKLHRAYITLPVYYTFNKKRNGYIKFEARTGNRIANSTLLDEVKKEHNRDSINFDKMDLDYFKNNSYRLLLNYDINEKFGFQAGAVYYYRCAEDMEGFKQLGKPYRFNAFAPLFQLQYRPRGYLGPFLIFDYERGLNNILGAHTEYGRWEFDAYHTFGLNRMRFWFVRGGLGFYTHRGKNVYFLDYENFRKKDVPEGWDDDWSGEFELLDGNWYNAADYYLRAHATYESPLLLLSWIPIAGQVLERERIYVSILGMRRMSPYVECGYGFTNRVFSMGMFTAFSNKGYDGFGFKFGFELFNKWR